MKKSRWNKLLAAFIIMVLLIVIFVLYLYNIIPHRVYTAADFDIETIVSNHDENGNGIDDFTDILLGAKAEIADMPTYRSAYYQGGYPPDEEGVCTDVIWRALRHAGYDFKSMMDEDIAQNVDAYPRVGGNPDPNIDFRRVPNVHSYLERHAQKLTLDTSDIAQWQPGDIIVFSDSHVGILSDKRNFKGVPFLLHNGNLPKGEEDCLWREDFLKGISGHYRFIIKE